MIWTTDMDATLVSGWNEGLSSFEIAGLIGSPITASAVRGRRADIGLPPRTHETLVLAGLVKGGWLRQAVQPLPSSERVPLCKPKPFAERERFECAFIIAEDRETTLACCAPIQPGARRPYCDFHLTLTGAAHAA